MRIPGLIFLLLAASTLSAETITVTVLATTDMHGHIYPVDSFTGKPAPRGLAKAATLIREARRQSSHSVLIDCGDTIQGSPLEYVYQTYVRNGKGPAGVDASRAGLAGDPMMLAMNRIGYDAMAVGNHEYNFGLKNLLRARSDAKFPWISANTTVAPGGSEKPYPAFFVKTVGGVKVAIVGITTPAVPTWEKPENMGSYRWGPAGPAVRRAMAELRSRERPDVVVAAVHAGLSGGSDGNENVVEEVAAAAPDLDAIVFGHTHSSVEGRRVNGVLVVQPKNFAASVARLDLTLEKQGGTWKVTSRSSRLLPATDSTPAAQDILELARPYHELAERYLSTPVTRATRELSGLLGRVEDTPLADAVQQVQLYYTKADVSFTALFNPGLKIQPGPVTVRQIAALYPYDNELYLIEGTGRLVKDALENAARYYLSCEGARCTQPPLLNSKVMGFNYDMAEGVEYEIDLSRPEGDRVRNLRWKGKPLAPGQPLKIAVNNYRAAGSAGYDMFKGARIVWHSQEEIREMIVRYYSESRPLPDKATGNWRVIPDAARATLERQALEYASRPGAY